MNQKWNNFVLLIILHTISLSLSLSIFIIFEAVGSCRNGYKVFESANDSMVFS
jgi:hypothetical protein